MNPHGDMDMMTIGALAVVILMAAVVIVYVGMLKWL